MTRLELIQSLVRQARANGFEFRKWYVTRIGLPWKDFDDACQQLARERRYYALVFSHEFAQSIWKDGDKITFVVPNTTFTRSRKDGTIFEVERKAYTRRSARQGVWRYHLQQVALAEDPLRYMRRYLVVAEHLADGALDAPTLDELPDLDVAAIPLPASTPFRRVP